MGRRNKWEMFFDGYAPNYMTEAFTKNTVKEIDFVLEELKLTPARASRIRALLPPSCPPNDKYRALPYIFATKETEFCHFKQSGKTHGAVEENKPKLGFF
jgi:hypothetical protein